MTEKVKVTKEIANAIERIKDDKLEFETIVFNQIKGCWRGDEYVPLKDLSTTQLATALINGYEVEMTPEDIIRNRWNNISYSSVVAKKLNDKESLYRCNGIKDGIETTLNALNIKIKGIND